MIKRLILSLCFIVIAGSASAQQYAKAIFYGDVELRSWTALSSFTASTTTGALTGTYYYRASGTNLAGRIPATSVTNLTCSSNGVILRWKRKDGLMGYVVERSTNGTMWDEWKAVSITLTNFTDTGALTWSAGGFTNLFTAIPAPQAIGFGTGVSVVAFSGVTGIPEDNSELVRWGAEIGAEADTNALAQLRIETNRAQLAEAALGLRIDGTNGLVSKTDTNAWETGSHADLYPRNNPSNYTTAADITAATGTLGTASRSYADAAVTAGTGAVATALRGEITAATNANYRSLTNWVAAQGYGTGSGGITSLVATADAAGVPSQITATRWGIGTNTTGLGGGTYTLPMNFTGRTYLATYDDTSALYVGVTQYVWTGSSYESASGAFAYTEGWYFYWKSDPGTIYEQTPPATLPNGVYYEGASPSFTAEFHVLTNVFVSGVGGLRVSATDLSGLTRGEIVSNTEPRYLAGVTNLTVTGPASATRTGGTVALVVSNQQYSGFAVSNITSAIALGTCTITRAMGRYLLIQGGAPLTLTVQSSDWSAADWGVFALGIASTGSVTFAPATMTNAQAAASWSTTATNNLIFFKGIGSTLWVGR